MLIGMDVGGTNTDVAIVGDEIVSVKVPNDRGIPAALDRITSQGRLGVSSSQPLNRILTGDPVRVVTILFPGPGLAWPGLLKGSINHRGDAVERIDPDEVRGFILENPGDAVAIASKFSVRNPVLEEEATDLAKEHYPDERIARSAPLALLDFPARVTTTRLNARLKETVCKLTAEIGKGRPDFFFFKGDGGLASPQVVRENPSLLFNSSAAAVALGAFFLSREKECVVVDIGGTTTDLVPLHNGSPRMRSLISDGERTLAETVETLSIPFGGDSELSGGLQPHRMGNALAFGGPRPTLTDALNVEGAEIGDPSRSVRVGKSEAEDAVDRYLDQVSYAVKETGMDRIVGAGFLAPILIPRIARRAGMRFTVHTDSGCANAVGVAVSRVSLTLHARFDSGRKRAVLNGEVQGLKCMGDDDSLIGFCREEVRRRALAAGAYPEDVRKIDLVSFQAYDVVRGGFRAERIADVVVRIPPGITMEAL